MRLANLGLAAGGTPSVELGGEIGDAGFAFKFDENAADLFNVLVVPDQVFVTKKIAKTKLVSLALGLGASVERSIFSPQLFSRIAGHPKRFFIGHFRGAPEVSLISL